MVHLDYRDGRPIYAQIADRYREQIVAGILEAGDKLPSVRELAVQLSINPNTIQRSYRQLEAEGWIATVPGKGCFVCGLPAYTQEQRLELLTAFDKSVAALLRIGMTRAELVARLQEEGNDYA